MARVTLGIATYNRDTYLAEAIQSCLSQDYDSLEVLVVVDGATNPKINEVLAGFANDPRLRVVRHETNLGIAAAYNTLLSEGGGELIAMLGDDDVCLPGRIRREVEIFDRYPDTGVVHGDAIVIDADGAEIGAWNSPDLTPGALVRCLYTDHNYLVDPTRMVHRRVYEQVGGYDDRFGLAQDFDFWLRAGRHFRFRHCDGGPLIKLRRHGDNGSDESQHTREVADVALALEESLERYSLRELVPELDWPLLEATEAERQALLALATSLEKRTVPVPTLASKLRRRASTYPSPKTPARNGRRLLITMFGWDDPGGGTTMPRLIAKELVRRGWEVSVFHASTKPAADGTPYAVSSWEEDGVRLVGVHNRPSFVFDLGQPLRELDDPQIRLAFRQELEHFKPEVVHFHNLHNLGASLMGEVSARGIPSYFTTHNYWLLCPQGYLMTDTRAICDGPGDGSRCAQCVGSFDAEAHRYRFEQIRAQAGSALTRILAVSDAVRRTLIAVGYDAELIDVVRQTTPHDGELWTQLGASRVPGRAGERLTIGYVGSAQPHKGPQLLIQAAQQTEAQIDVKIFGSCTLEVAEHLRALDSRGVVELCGSYSASELSRLLAQVDAVALPSTWWDCAPLTVQECLSARLPVLIPRLGGLTEAIHDQVNGLTFNPLDPGDLARQLDRLASEQGLLEQLQAGIEAPPDFGAHVDAIEAYYDGERPGRVKAALSAEQVTVRWKGEHGKPTSLSIVNDEVSSRLPGPLRRVTPAVEPLDHQLPHPALVEVRHQWPADLSPSASGALAAIVPWEFGSVPRQWVDQIQANVDEVWVPSEFVRAMYVADGIDPERVRVIPNGVDLQRFRPVGSPLAEASVEPTGRDDTLTTFLFVGGLVWRKGPDILLDAWKRAFAGREDVILVVKDFGADSVYVSGEREGLTQHAASGALPRVKLIQGELDPDQVAELYRSADVLVHPYRGEGFAMPVLEAMASALPVITTAGGPTDEFCPPQAGWRINARRVPLDPACLTGLEPASKPWVLEPDRDHLVELLREAQANPAERRARGAAAHSAAQAYSWDVIADRYTERIRTLANAPRRCALEPFPFESDADVRVLATPAWRNHDALPALLAEWATVTSAADSACLYLLADPATDGSPEELEAFVLSAAQRGGADLDACADIDVLMEPLQPGRDLRLHASINAYVALHAGCAGHLRLARQAGKATLQPGDGGLVALLSACRQRVPA